MKPESRRIVVQLGLVSLFADVAGEMLAPILPLYITGVLGAPAFAVGLIDGSAELAASAFRAVGGWWSDANRRRKPIVVLGYSLAAAAKPALSLFAAWPWVLFCRVLDRTGKGLRGTARDALIASTVESEHWGRAFGLHRSMDTAGAVAGPLLAMFLLNKAGLGYRALFLIAGLPAFAAVLVLGLVREGPSVSVPSKSEGRGRLGPSFWRFLFIYGLFALGNSSDSFILLKGRAAGFAVPAVILAYVLFNLVNASTAAWIGRRADRIGRRKMLALGATVYAICYSGFAVASRASVYWALFALYGLQAALMEGSFRAVVSEFSDAHNCGTAHGVFQSAVGLLSFAASVIAGTLWSKLSPSAPFWFGAACAALSAAGMLATLSA